MFIYQKKLQYPINIRRPNPKLASVIISQYGGPDGELGASLRYLSQRYAMPYDEMCIRDSLAYVLETGNITMRGTGAELLADEKVKEAYLGKHKAK